MKKAVVIGSGFGGLSVAIRLQSRGFDVTLLEKHHQVGGHASQLTDSGYTFDMGPSLITAPSIIQRLFDRAGRQLHEVVDLVRLEPGYRIYFHDQSYIDYSSDPDQMKEQMARFNRRDADNYDKYMQVSRRLYEAVIQKGLGSKPFMDLKTMAAFVPQAIRLRALLPASTFAALYFRDPRHRFTFSFHPLFIGGNPFRAPAVYQMIPYLERKEGIWYSIGGMHSLVHAFAEAFTALGGKILTQAEAREIVIKNGRAIGVKVADQVLPADVVISDADFVHTYRDLIRPEHRKKWNNRRLERLHYSMSAVLLYIGSKKQYPELLHHTLILSKRYKELITDIFDRRILPLDFSMYLHAPTRTDPSMAPQDKESLYVLIPVANLAANTDWQQEKDRFAERVLNHLEQNFGLADLKQNIEVLHIFTPQDFQSKTNAHLGSAWGVEPRLTQTAFLRPHNRSEDVQGLYIVGASTHPGAGLPGVMLTAETTENVILSDFKIDATQSGQKG
ncbi:phytoene desaturase [candidate division KSB1 bacterium]|nr:phytoene desaturase [candidate division KSB1 bacterium]